MSPMLSAVQQIIQYCVPCTSKGINTTLDPLLLLEISLVRLAFLYHTSMSLFTFLVYELNMDYEISSFVYSSNSRYQDLQPEGNSPLHEQRDRWAHAYIRYKPDHTSWFLIQIYFSIILWMLFMPLQTIQRRIYRRILNIN